jgi:hypothetical protein
MKNLIEKEKVIDIVEDIINMDKDHFYRLCCDIENGHYDFPPEVIYEHLDLLFEEIKENILKDKK